MEARQAVCTNKAEFAIEHRAVREQLPKGLGYALKAAGILGPALGEETNQVTVLDDLETVAIPLRLMQPVATPRWVGTIGRYERADESWRHNSYVAPPLARTLDQRGGGRFGVLGQGLISVSTFLCQPIGVQEIADVT